MKHKKYTKNIIKRIKTIITPLLKFHIFEKLLKCYYKYQHRRHIKMMSKSFHKNASKILREFDSALSKNGIDYSIAFGTLLGAVRENGFIKNDLDIDVAIWYDQDIKTIENILILHGFKLIRRSETDNGLFSHEDTYEKDGVLIDIFTFYPYDNTNLAYTTVFVPFDGCESFDESIKQWGGVMPIQLVLPFSTKTTRIPFEDFELPAINNYMDFIIARYGNNWKEPDPNYEYYVQAGEGKCIKRKDKITKLLLFEH